MSDCDYIGKHLRGCIDHPDPESRRGGPWTTDHHNQGE